MIAALISASVSVLLAGAAVVYATGRNVEALTGVRAVVGEMRETLQRFGERLGRLETRGEVEREFSGRVQR